MRELAHQPLKVGPARKEAGPIVPLILHQQWQEIITVDPKCEVLLYALVLDGLEVERGGAILELKLL